MLKLASMGAKPKADTPEQLIDWMYGYLKSTGKVKDEEPDQHREQVRVESDIPSIPKKTSASLHMVPQTPRVSFFSGDPSAKGDVSFDLWKFEVMTLMKNGQHTTDTIKMAVIKSLKGEAARVAMRLGHQVTTRTLLDKLESRFGAVEQGQCLLSQFYSAKQFTDESVSKWACRIEDLLDRARDEGEVDADTFESKLRSKFWSGLNQDLKDRSAHKYDRQTDFEDLLREVRRIERDTVIAASTPPAKSTSKSQLKMMQAPAESEVEDLRTLIASLTVSVQSLQKEVKGMKHDRHQESTLTLPPPIRSSTPAAPQKKPL